jgi:hypothetical protein
MVLLRTLIVSVGIPITLFFIMLVETDRVTHGIRIFEKNEDLARLASWVLIILNMVIEFLVVYQEDKHGYISPVEYKWSLRLWFKNFRYRMGFSKDPQEKSPANVFNKMLGVVTMAILFLALLGSMLVELEKQNNLTWYDGIIQVVTKSNAKDFLTWIAGVLFAYTLVISAQGLSNYVAYHTTGVLKSMLNMKSEIENMELEDKLSKDISIPKLIAEGIVLLGEKYVAKCDECAFTKEFDDVERAKSSLRSHKAFHTMQKKNSVGVQPPTE